MLSLLTHRAKVESLRLSYSDGPIREREREREKETERANGELKEKEYYEIERKYEQTEIY
jgi:hypothetical protein